MRSLSDELAEIRAGLVETGPLVSHADAQRNYKARKRNHKKQCIAILDMETDPFDNKRPNDYIFPFLAVLYSDQFETVIIWEENYEIFINRLIASILALPSAFTIYAHNGGKFDFMFLVHKLRGEVSFKGRGIMRASIGPHELRDSYHIIPEKLATMAKQKFDYERLRRQSREQWRTEIIAYCISDCENLFAYVKRFIEKYGFKISIGAAAIAKLGEHYKVDKVAPSTDTMLRNFFFGGRVECIAGAGYYAGNFKLYDVNSMYPYAMANFNHPIGSDYLKRPGRPNNSTIFLRLTCANNGALLGKDDTGNLVSNKSSGEFFTSKWEYETALELGLIADVRVLECIDNFRFTNFEKFVTPLYTQRALEKAALERLTQLGIDSGSEFDAINSEVLFLKLILNNAYGKFAQNPRRYKDHFLTDPGERPVIGDDEPDYDRLPEFEGETYWIWSRPSPSLRFNNVGTAASITGAARSILMRAIHGAKNPIYCDTDSLICEELRGQRIHKTELGAWDLEKEISELIVCGKKLYAYKTLDGTKTVVRSKGTAGLEWNDMLGMLEGDTRTVTNRGATLTKTGRQYYISRRIARTAPLRLASA